jgi:uncharacterized protein YwgA
MTVLQDNKKHRAEAIEPIVEEYKSLLQKGEALALEDFLKKYPELEIDLRPRLEAVQILMDTAKLIPPMTEALKKKLHDRFWAKALANEKKRLLRVKDEIVDKSLFRLKTRIEFVPLLLYGKSNIAEEKQKTQLGTKTGKTAHAIRGITRIMKLLFLLEKEAGCDKYVPNYYQFESYKLGPFSIEVYEDIRLLNELGFVKRVDYDQEGLPVIYADDSKIDEGFRFNDVTTIYALTDLGEKYAEKLRKGLKPAVLEKIDFIKNRFAQASLKGILRYVYEHYPEYTTQSEILEDVLRE